jgi:hypothetical protein
LDRMQQGRDRSIQRQNSYQPPRPAPSTRPAAPGGGGTRPPSGGARPAGGSRPASSGRRG